MSDQAIANAATGKPKSDLIRNWRRAMKEGQTARSVRLHSLGAVAAVLGVSEEWLSTGTGPMDNIDPLEAELLSLLRSVPPDRRPQAAKAALATIRLAVPDKIVGPQGDDASAPLRAPGHAP